MCVHISMCVCRCICVCLHVSICLCVHISIGVYVSMCSCIHMSICVYRCMYLCVFVLCVEGCIYNKADKYLESPVIPQVLCRVLASFCVNAQLCKEAAIASQLHCSMCTDTITPYSYLSSLNVSCGYLPLITNVFPPHSCPAMCPVKLSSSITGSSWSLSLVTSVSQSFAPVVQLLRPCREQNMWTETTLRVIVQLLWPCMGQNTCAKTTLGVIVQLPWPCREQNMYAQRQPSRLRTGVRSKIPKELQTWISGRFGLQTRVFPLVYMP